MRKQNDGSAGNCLVAKYIGSDFDHVMNVSENMEAVKHVNGMDEQIKKVLPHVDNIKKVGDGITDVIDVSDNMIKVSDVHNNMDSVQVTAHNINTITAVRKDLHDIEEVINNLDSIKESIALEPKLDQVIRNEANIEQVGANIGAVVNVSTNMRDVHSVVAMRANIDAVGSVRDEVATIGASIYDVEKVSDGIAKITKVADGFEHITKISPFIDDVSATGTHIQDVVTVSQNLDRILSLSSDIYEVTDPKYAQMLADQGYNVIGASFNNPVLTDANELFVHNGKVYSYVGGFPHQVAFITFQPSYYQEHLVNDLMKQFVLTSVVGSKPIDLVAGLVIKPVKKKYPTLIAFDGLYELADNADNYTVKSFTAGADKASLTITLANDSKVYAVRVEAASKNWVKNGAKILARGSLMPRKFKDFFADVVNVKNYGAVGDYYLPDGSVNPNPTDDTEAIQAAITAAGLANNPFLGTTGAGSKKVVFPTDAYYVKGTLYVASETHIDLNRSIIVGNKTNTLFSTGYVKDAKVISNWGSQLEHDRVLQSKIKNGTLLNCDIGFNLRNFNEGCEISDIYFLDCGQAAYAFRCFYSSWTSCFVRSTTGSSNDPRGAFHFHSYINVQKMDRIFIEGRKLGFDIDGSENEGVDGSIMINCGAEQCDVGIRLLHSLRPFTIQSCYFEKISGIAINAYDASARQFSVKGCWFGECKTGFRVNAWDAGEFSDDNTWVDTTGTGIFVDANTNQSFGTVRIPPTRIAGNGAPTIPNYYRLSNTINIECKNYIFDVNTGSFLIKQAYTNDIAELSYTGRAGEVKSGIAYVTTSNEQSRDGKFIIKNLTHIPLDNNVCGVYNIAVTEGGTAYKFCGRFYGTTVVEDVSQTTKAVIVRANSTTNMIELLVSGIDSSNYAVNGVIRHM